MEIELRELEEGANAFEWSESPEELHIEDGELDFTKPIHTRITVYKMGDSVSASGETEFELRMACVRCLDPFKSRMRGDFRFILQQGRPASMEADEDEAVIWLDDEKGKIDLGEHVKDYILLEIPMNPICSVSCEGLCPSCGQNLNLGRCECKQEKTDPRWEALQGFTGE